MYVMRLLWKSGQLPGCSKYGFIPGNGDGMIRPRGSHHCSRYADASGLPSPETFLRPGVAAHVVAAVFPRLPETRPVLGHELDPADPLGTLPGVQSRDDQPHRIAVIRLQIVAIMLHGEQGIVAEKVGHWQVRGEAVLAMNHDTLGFR